MAFSVGSVVGTWNADVINNHPADPQDLENRVEALEEQPLIIKPDPNAETE